MSWLRVSFPVDSCLIERLTAELQRLGVVSVSLSSADGNAVFETNLDSELLWDRTFLQAIFPVNFNPAILPDVLDQFGIKQRRVDFLPEQDWIGEWQKSLLPNTFGHISVCPRHYTETTTQTVIKLDPGLAFGTGEHPTTAMCLQWLSKQNLIGKRVLDFGCGSGILGIAAKKLGAGSVVLVDNDRLSLETALENAQFNQVEVSLESSISKLNQEFDVIIANILLNVLVNYADRLSELLMVGGEIVLSGVLREQYAAITCAYSGIEFQQTDWQDEWLLIHGCKARA
ncbi:MAG: 50S ribosomal protein L11 methyltransferase [Gammaproteobacteria bacterium]|nr:50S ribosomal protein L11 methyltransferase [Gammaproteobacteria bacterium]MYF53980.1 50S ribosomal protein L11 methyltransferase [Gammaproteobacteria bacterium]MYK43662.1 50S ribosomal protein L11 methyltransferase [Gammaproteobacteria bacterium]